MDEILDNQDIDETAVFQVGMDESADDFVLSPLEAVEDRLMYLRDSNQSFYLAFKAYHDDYDYEQAIEDFQAAIEHETAATEDSPVQADEDEEQQPEEPSSVIVRSMYWQAESYVKIGKIDIAIEVFTALSSQYQMHHLGIAAERRVEVLKEYHQEEDSV